MILSKPLKRIKLTQPFGVDWTGVGLYKSMGMTGHNGLDFSAPVGADVFAVCDGLAYIEIERPPGTSLPGYTSGYGINIKIRNKDTGMEVIYGHLSETLIKHGQEVKAGDLIAKSGNTGISNGPHLHLGVRRIYWDKSGAGPYVGEYKNGYFGYYDPLPLFGPDFQKLPVDFNYGSKVPGMGELQFYAANAYFFSKTKRLLSPREKSALVYGYWDLRSVLDDALFSIWTEMTKIEARAKHLV